MNSKRVRHKQHKGVAQLGVVVSTNSEVKVRGEGEDGGWGKAAIEKAEVVDGEAILTIPASADKGFFIVNPKPDVPSEN